MAIHIQRREFISLLGGAAAWPLAARAQQAMPVIGFLSAGSSAQSVQRIRAFLQGLQDTGFVEGSNVSIDYRWAEDGQYDQLPAMAADLVRRQVAVIVAPAVVAALAAKAATTSIPIVFLSGIDPVEARLVDSLARPGGNITGLVSLGVELGPKSLELLREAAPNATVIGALVNPINPNAEVIAKMLQAASGNLGLQINVLHASTDRDIETVFARLVQLRADGLFIGPDQLFNTRREQLAALALQRMLPAIYTVREFTVAGGLMSYGDSQVGFFRQLGIYAGRILKSEKPADLPVQQATKVELVINLKTAKALGLTIPISLLGRADEVIE